MEQLLLYVWSLLAMVTKSFSRDEDAAKDLIQDVCLYLLRKQNELLEKPVDQQQAYAMMCVKNGMVNVFRTRKLHQKLDEHYFLNLNYVTYPTVLRDFEISDFRKFIHQIRFGPELLLQAEGYSCNEITIMTKAMSINTTVGRLRQGKIHLAKFYKNEHKQRRH